MRQDVPDGKTRDASMHGYPAFNKAIATFRFFAERTQTRPHNKEQALRGAYLAAALACIALDSALEGVVYEDHDARYRAIADGVTYGDAGDARVQSSIKTVLEVIGKGMENGRVVAKQANDALETMFKSVRADIIAEYFTKEHNSSALFALAKELDDHAHSVDATKIQTLSIEAKSVLGIFADFVQVNRVALLNSSPETTSAGSPKAQHERSDAEETLKEHTDPNQAKLL
jgi:hypothetical protein